MGHVILNFFTASFKISLKSIYSYIVQEKGKSIQTKLF